MHKFVYITEAVYCHVVLKCLDNISTAPCHAAKISLHVLVSFLRASWQLRQTPLDYSWRALSRFEHVPRIFKSSWSFRPFKNRQEVSSSVKNWLQKSQVTRSYKKYQDIQFGTLLVLIRIVGQAPKSRESWPIQNIHYARFLNFVRSPSYKITLRVVICLIAHLYFHVKYRRSAGFVGGALGLGVVVHNILTVALTHTRTTRSPLRCAGAYW